jgi:hypothetical protein
VDKYKELDGELFIVWFSKDNPSNTKTKNISS